MEIQDVEFVVDIDEHALEAAVRRIRHKILDRSKCPECGDRAIVNVTTEARKTTDGKRSVILEAECKAIDAACTWEHRLMVGAGLTIESKDPRGGTA